MTMTMEKPTENQADHRHRELWDAAIEEYGSATAVPKDVARDIGEEVRALYVLALAWDGTGSPHSILRSYAVLPNIMAKLAGEEVKQERPEKRRDKYAKLIELSRANLFKEFTTDELIDHSGLGRNTVISWCRSTGHFRQNPDKRGVWEARDPNHDRRAEG